MRILSLAAGLAALAIAATATAGPNLASNGSFELSDYATPDNNHSGYEFGIDVFNNGFVHQGVTDWTATLDTGISFYYFANSDPVNRPILNRFGDQSAKIAASYTGPSPDGGNFVGFDSDFIGDPGYGHYNSPLVQTINGLTPGKATTLTFYWAGTQLQNRHGPTTDWLTYSLGSDTRATNVVTVADQGFTGWKKVYAKFTPTSSSETLQFLAFGTPAGLPPFVLLDGVSLAVPEPATWALLFAGFGMVGVASRKRNRSVAA